MRAFGVGVERITVTAGGLKSYSTVPVAKSRAAKHDGFGGGNEAQANYITLSGVSHDGCTACLSDQLF